MCCRLFTYSSFIETQSASRVVDSIVNPAVQIKLCDNPVDNNENTKSQSDCAKIRNLHLHFD